MHVFRHPNVVAVEEVFEDEYAVYIVMELCSGGDLAEFIRSHAKLDRNGAGAGRCSERDAASIIRTVLQVRGCGGGGGSSSSSNSSSSSSRLSSVGEMSDCYSLRAIAVQ